MSTIAARTPHLARTSSAVERIGSNLLSNPAFKLAPGEHAATPVEYWQMGMLGCYGDAFYAIAQQLVTQAKSEADRGRRMEFLEDALDNIKSSAEYGCPRACQILSEI